MPSFHALPATAIKFSQKEEKVLYLSKPNLLFLKPKKVAGTSFEIALSVSATPADIVTPISLEDELIRIDQNGLLPINWSRQPQLESTYISLVQQIHRIKKTGVASPDLKTKRQQLKDLINIKGHRIYYNHITPVEIIESFGEERFADAFKVTITRHPYEQIVSQAYWLSQGKLRKQLPLAQIIDELLVDPAPNTPYYFDDNKKLCDFYIKMENFQSDTQKLETNFGLQIWRHMPVTKKSGSSSRPKASEILTKEQKQKVQSRSKLEFELFDYNPD
jgi:hypothetical protein